MRRAASAKGGRGVLQKEKLTKKGEVIAEDMRLEYVRDFADAVLTNRPLAISGEDGAAGLKVVEAVCRSAEEKRWGKV